MLQVIPEHLQKFLRVKMDEIFIKFRQTKKLNKGREPWSSGYGWRLMFQRLQVQIPALYTGWTFFTYLFAVKFLMCF